MFVPLRDRYGTVQLVFRVDEVSGLTQEEYLKLNNQLSKLYDESVVQVKGVVQSRPLHMMSQKNGQIELVVNSLQVLNDSSPLPYSLTTTNVDERITLTHRYLELRKGNIVLNT
jgi:aspartyl-tRNA synthetase